MKFMIEYISTSSENHFLLFNIRISINLQSRSAVRNSMQSRSMFIKTRKYYYNKICCNK